MTLIFYVCTYCGWVEETPETKQCTRCRCRVKRLTNDQVLALLDAAEILFCEACQHVHSGPLLRLDTKGMASGEDDAADSGAGNPG